MRTSFGLVMLTVSVVLVADLLGLVPSTRDNALTARNVIAESLAVQVSAALHHDALSLVEPTLQAVVERNELVLSAGLRDSTGTSLVSFGDHAAHWTLDAGEASVPTQVRVPIYAGTARWGDVEMRFVELAAGVGQTPWHQSLHATLVFVALSGFGAYFLFLRRILRERNPDAVIPERVGMALNTLSEGLVIVDKDDHLLFANAAFAEKTGWPAAELVGRRSADMHWVDTDGEPTDPPWLASVQHGESVQGASLALRTASGDAFHFVVNASPIGADGEDVRGALVTFDDITEVEVKNEALQKTLDKLEQSQREITRQNRALHVLATRDSLTGALNRRALFDGFAALIEEARSGAKPLSCIMVDIDHFKSVNDRFGHAAGDQVIKMLARILTRHSRPNDLVGRLGGEEFCVVLPGVTAAGCREVADRMRQAVARGDGARFTDDALRVTSSFGVSTLVSDTQTPQELVERADQALYDAKNSGRNRVVAWSTALASVSASVADDADVEGNGMTAVPVVVLEEPDADLDTVDMGSLAGLEFGLPGASPELDTELRYIAESANRNLPGRVLLFDRMEQSIKRAQRQGTEFAVVVLTLEKLQRVANTMGSGVAEKLAKLAVSRIQNQLRDTDTVTLAENEELMFSISRLEGGEVVILLTDLSNTQIVQVLLQRILRVFDVALMVEGDNYHVDVRAGVSVFPGDGAAPEALLKAASSAVQDIADNDTRRLFRFYDTSINERMVANLRLESDLHDALDSRSVTVQYQPKIDLRTGRMQGVEALARWQHPEFGFVPPHQFIELAERNGLMGVLSQQVLGVVCGQLAAWREAGFECPRVAVNFSPVEFRNPDLASDVAAELFRHGVPANALEVEITEAVLLQDMQVTARTLRQFTEMGCSVALDDFGTGYSSLSYLKHFPLTRVKIDHSFIADLLDAQHSAAIVSAIIAMAQSLGLRVIAEGVETEAQLHFLQELQCDEVQGECVSPPLFSDAMTTLLSDPSALRTRIIERDPAMSNVAVHPRMAPQGGVLGVLNAYPAPGDAR
ncbi:MAG: EAL domain-containing protein [Pseudomonadota bacterium]